jgi:hypothetical protein
VKAAATLKALKRLVLLEPNETEAQQVYYRYSYNRGWKDEYIAKGKALEESFESFDFLSLKNYNEHKVMSRLHTTQQDTTLRMTLL